MVVTATRTLGSGQLILGIVSVDGEEFLLVEENINARCMIMIPIERVVVDPMDVIRHSSEYALYRNENGSFIGVYSPPAIDSGAVME